MTLLRPCARCAPSRHWSRLRHACPSPAWSQGRDHTDRMLSAGRLTITVQFANQLKDKDIIFRQDPYCVLQCGGTTKRTNTAKSGGTSPVWNESFTFEVINENDIQITVKDSDVFSDEFLGRADISLATVRQRYTDTQAVQLYSHHNVQRGTVHVTLQFEPNGAPAPYPQPAGYPAPQYGAPTAPPQSPQPPASYPSQPAYSGYPPQQPSYPPQQAYGGYPQPQPQQRQQSYAAYPPQQPPSYPPQVAYGGYPQPGYYPPQQSTEVVIIEEERHRHHHHHHEEEVVIIEQQGGYAPPPYYPPPYYPQPVFVQPPTEVIIVEEHHRHHHHGW